MLSAPCAVKRAGQQARMDADNAEFQVLFKSNAEAVANLPRQGREKVMFFCLVASILLKAIPFSFTMVPRKDVNVCPF